MQELTPTLSDGNAYRFLQPLTAPVAKYGADVHLSTPEVAQVLFDGWMAYLSEGTGLGDALWSAPVIPNTRDMNMQILREIRAGDALVVGVRALSRRRRSFVLGVTLRRAADQVEVASCTAVLVCVDGTGAAEVPDRLWAAVEALEGRSIPADVGGAG